MSWFTHFCQLDALQKELSLHTIGQRNVILYTHFGNVMSWSASGRDEHAPCMSPPPPHTVEQPQACSISRSFMAASVAKANHLHLCRCMVLTASTLHKQRRARTLRRPSLCTVEQPQACSISWSFMAASVAKANHLQVQVHGPHGRHSPQAETSTPLRPPASRTVEQPQACSVSRSVMAAFVAK